MARATASITLRGLRITSHPGDLALVGAVIPWSDISRTSDTALFRASPESSAEPFLVRLTCKQRLVTRRVRERAMLRALERGELRFVNPAKPPKRFETVSTYAIAIAMLIFLPSFAMYEFTRDSTLDLLVPGPNIVSDEFEFFVWLTRIFAFVAFVVFTVVFPLLMLLTIRQQFSAWHLERIERNVLTLVRGETREQILIADISRDSATRVLHLHSFSANGEHYRLLHVPSLPQRVTRVIFPRSTERRSPSRAHRRVALLFLAFIPATTALVLWGYGIGLVETRAAIGYPVMAVCMAAFYGLAVWRNRQPRA